MSERQLLLSKAMLMRGESVLQSSGIFDASISLLLLQDAVEMALHAVATKIGAKPPRKAAFEDYWGLIDSAGTQFGQLPMKIDMGRMNSARVDLKHHGNHPDRDGVKEHFRNGRAFLGKSQPNIAYSGDCDRRFRPNMTGHSAGSALCGFITSCGHVQSTFAALSPLRSSCCGRARSAVCTP
jgi:hypothetical protein